MPKQQDKEKVEPKQETVKANNSHDDDELSSESSSDDDSLVLEGVLVRNPDVSSSSDDDDSDDNDDEDDKEKSVKDAKQSAQSSKRPAAAASKSQQQPPPKKAKKTKKPKQPRRKTDEPEIDTTHVDFIFCDMAEHYFHGCKALLSNGASLYQAHSSALADAMVEYDMVGTVIGQPDDPEHTVYGFGSLVHWVHLPATAQTGFTKVSCHQNVVTGTNQQTTAKAAAKACQARLQSSLTACQTKTTPAVAVLLTGRMINLPVEIVLSLHQQVWLDIQWAQTEKTKQSYKNITTVLRLAPCTRDDNNNNDSSSSSSSSYVYRYFEDELLAEQAKKGSSYFVTAPKSFSREDQVYLHVLELDLEGYQRGIQALERLVNHGTTTTTTTTQSSNNSKRRKGK